VWANCRVLNVTKLVHIVTLCFRSYAVWQLSDVLFAGIVRGVDMQQKRLFIITPVPESVLSAVNCLILGTIMLPSYVYCNASEHTGEISYMATGPGHPLSKVSRRIFRPLQPICGTQK
jgi:hypothetical protein